MSRSTLPGASRFRQVSAPAAGAGARLLAGAFAAALLLAGCGGSGEAGTSGAGGGSEAKLEVLSAGFPLKQSVARAAQLVLTLRNGGTAAINGVNVYVNSFYYRSALPNLSDPSRPNWIVDEGPGAIPTQPVESVPFDSPGGDVTATQGNWSAGSLAAGQSRTLRWKLTPVQAGRHTIAYTVQAGRQHPTGLHAEGPPVQGRFTVEVAVAPPARFVNPQSGAVEFGRAPAAP